MDVPLSLLLVFSLSTTLAVSQPTIAPMRDQFTAVNSGENVTYNCSVGAGRTVVWEIRGSQILRTNQFSVIRSMGYFIDPMNTESNSSFISISETARENNSEIVVQCVASLGGFFDSIKGEMYRVVTFTPPESPGDLVLDPALTLVWGRPMNVPNEVDITYIVEINSTDNTMNFKNTTSETTISLLFLEEMLPLVGRVCVEFEFFISATNDAGVSPLVRIMDTVPISPDVTNISADLRVDRVDLQSSTVAISFPEVVPCSENFLLTNYTININEVVYVVLNRSDTTSGVTLSGLSEDNTFSLSVTACNEVTCRTSTMQTINTTDVQAVEVVFFENRLFLRCSFADNSQARGCIVNLILSSTNETERFEVARQGSSGSMCTTANNQREVYGSVVVQDWEVDGGEGNVTLNIANIIFNLTSSEFIELTGCREEGGSSTAAIVGGVLGGVLIVVVVVIILVLCIYFKKRNRKGGFSAGPPAPPIRFIKLSERIYQRVVETDDCGELLRELMRHRSASAAEQESKLTNGDDSKEPLVTSAENIQLRETHPKQQNNKIVSIEEPYNNKDHLTLTIHWKALHESLGSIQIPEGEDFSKVNLQFNFND